MALARSNTPLPHQEHTAVLLPPHIAIFGGIITSNDSNLTISVCTTPLMQIYSIANNTCIVRAPLLNPLNPINAAIVNGKIYVLGVLAESESAQGRAWRAANDSWVYVPYNDSWFAVPLPAGEERGSAAVGVYDANIYLAGSMTDLELFGNSKQSSVAVVSIFNTVTRKWLRVPDAAKFIPAGRNHAGAAVVGSQMYVLGGRNNG
jgi:hypothetical protein